ncbi:hypothetical protein BH09PSE6_BH09PSE6_28030 [soil metagenome]
MTVPLARPLRPSLASMLKLSVAIVVTCATLIALLVAQKGYPIAAMDWNNDGFTSPIEMLEAIDSDRQVVPTAAGDCDEYRRYKDQSVLARRCPAGKR